MAYGSNDKQAGTVAWFNTTKGYGFIKPDGGAPDVFVHITAVQAAGLHELSEGQRVRFQVTSDRGKQAATALEAA